jgi:hypothetical protein
MLVTKKAKISAYVPRNRYNWSVESPDVPGTAGAEIAVIAKLLEVRYRPMWVRCFSAKNA